VGALTSKPFRYSARTWELSRRKSVSPHDSTGANLIVQVKGQKVMRVVPLENEAVNECWIADRDRFSYEALNGDARLTQPMIKQGGEWLATDWPTALNYVADGLRRIRSEFGPQTVGALASPHATVEELHLLSRLVRGLGSENIDHRLRHADFSAAAPAGQARWLGMPMAELSTLDRALVVGSFLRKDHPLFAQRLRQATRRGARVVSLNGVDDDWLLPKAESLIVKPSDWPLAMARLAGAVARAVQVEPPVAVLPDVAADAAADRVAALLLTGERRAILLGNAAVQHPQSASLLALANWMAPHLGARVGVLGEAANSVGAQLVGALPGPGGLNAAEMLTRPMKALLLMQVEPVLDGANAAATRLALSQAGLVVAFTPFRDVALEHADVLLPVAPFTETGGSFVNAEGRVQAFHGVVRPLGETRPGWKALRVLGNLLELPGFDQETVEEVRLQALGDQSVLTARLSNAQALDSEPRSAGVSTGLERLADVPIYSTDAVVRRAPSLQMTRDARPPVASLPSALWSQLQLSEGDKVLVSQGQAAVVLPACEDAALAADTVRVPAGHPATSALGAMFGPISVEKA
jgi:NADH-quinone oxidoreductase subunit G